MFELEYIYHDCFLLKSGDCTIIFDYWKDPKQSENNTPSFFDEIPSDRPLYVIVSHFHKDHFNKEIFGWAEIHQDIRYIISKDTARHAGHLLRDNTLYKGSRPDVSRVTVLRKGEEYSDNILRIKAFGSTDIGNSYALEIKSQGLKIFHAGDLNCWTWRDESTKEEIDAAELAFRKEIKPIAEEYPEFDVVMFPVDSRIGTGYAQGALEFVRVIKVAHFFPMHFELADSQEELEKRKADASRFLDYAAQDGEYIALTRRGDCFACDYENMRGDKEEYTIEQNDADDIVSKEIVLTREYFLSAGDTDAEREMSLPLLTSKLIDIATEHANHLGIGNPNMADDHSGWVLSRLTIEMSGYPVVNSHYKISTWVESWNRHFSERAFSIEDAQGNTLGYARSIWMVLDTLTHANAGLSGLPFRDEFISKRECPIQRQGKHLGIIPSSESESAKGKYLQAEGEPAGHVFLYSDLDAYRHVNTVRYVALLMNQFTLKEHDDYRVGRLELSFLHEGEHDQPIDILRAPIPSRNEDSRGYAFQLRRKADKNPILFSRLWLDKRADCELPPL
ncbi:MAG: MBL fold metallo-hydrolase [Muribaculaceae bacterium]|nr:MBL fold metallo-hydrolase [Muribaculaceae bacterium]